jgi:hypothetical protein
MPGNNLRSYINKQGVQQLQQYDNANERQLATQQLQQYDKVRKRKQ